MNNQPRLKLALIMPQFGLHGPMRLANRRLMDLQAILLILIVMSLLRFIEMIKAMIMYMKH